jgi:hypothetical protein
MKIATGVTLAFAFAAAPGLSAASATGKSCGVPGSKTLHVAEKVRIYAFHNHLYACSPRYGRKVFLYKSRYVPPNQVPALGNYAQWGQTVLTYVLHPAVNNTGSDEVTLVSRNLKTGAVRRQYLDNCGQGCGHITVTRLVTNAKGSFAWIEDDTGFSETYSVMEDDSAGFKLLDSEYGVTTEGLYVCAGPPNGPPNPPPQCHEKIDLGYLVAANGMVSWKGGPNETLQSASFN